MTKSLAGPERRTSLCGRANECAVLDRLVEDIRRGESRSLVLRGEAGIGKTALLEYLVESASDMTVVRAGLAVLLAGGSPVGPTPSGVRSQRRG